MSYFRNFENVAYRFGNGEDPVLFNRLTQFSGLPHPPGGAVRYVVRPGERPDTLSNKLYGTPDYHWMFFALNDKLWESGWPLGERELTALVASRFPRQTLTTMDPIVDAFPPETRVFSSVSDSEIVVRERNLSMGQIIVGISPLDDLAGGRVYYVDGEDLSRSVRVESHVAEARAIHHYEDADGNPADADPMFPVPADLVPVTNEDVLRRRNDDLREIMVPTAALAATLAASLGRSA